MKKQYLNRIKILFWGLLFLFFEGKCLEIEHRGMINDGSPSQKLRDQILSAATLVSSSNNFDSHLE